MTTTNDIEWGYNCLTRGVHHGRPETIWNIPLVYAATVMFRRQPLQDLVVARIHSDAMQFVEVGLEPRYSKEWADRVKELAAEQFLNTLKRQVGALGKYYKSPNWETDSADAVKRFQNGKLNPHYQPLHPQDSINLFCRILGTPASGQASEEFPRD